MKRGVKRWNGCLSHHSAADRLSLITSYLVNRGSSRWAKAETLILGKSWLNYALRSMRTLECFWHSLSFCSCIIFPEQYRSDANYLKDRARSTFPDKILPQAQHTSTIIFRRLIKNYDRHVITSAPCVTAQNSSITLWRQPSSSICAGRCISFP